MTTPRKRGRGRPRLAKETGYLHIRVPAAALDVYAGAAARAGVTVSGWVRSTLDRAARKVKP